MDRSIDFKMNNINNDLTAPFTSQVDGTGAFTPQPHPLMFNIDPTCYFPFWPQMPMPIPTNPMGGTAGTETADAATAANAEQKPPNRRRRRRRRRRRKTKIVYVPMPMMGQFGMPMPLFNMQTPSGFLTQHLFTEEAKATLAMHEEQLPTEETFPEIAQLREEQLEELKREISETLEEVQERLNSDPQVGVFSRELLEQHDFSISPLARCNSGDTERSMASDCESGESEEMELLNSQELQKKFEKESSMEEAQPINRSVSSGFFSLLHQQAAFQKQIKALKEAFDPFLVDLSSNEDTNSERGSVCPELVQEHRDSVLL